ncbi:MAG: DNA translocase FtsK 4TM domain-containing protein [Kiritimatiellae bacterium]|nr:DNA translocase FtsK 4TM domain-containing protein [Kiritimatiellia bacterium]
MTGSSSNTDNRKSERHALGWILFPIALFPLVALLTYDWHSIEALQTPPRPSSNWIGALGDGFAYIGYSAVGLAIWVVPALCIVAGLCRITGRRLHTGMRKLWLLAFVTSAACLMQSVQGNAPGMDALLSSLNISDAGGVVGYLLMTRLLAPLIGDFGAVILMAIVLCASMVCVVGIGNLAKIFKAVLRWMLAGGGRSAGEMPAEPESGSSPAYDAEQEKYMAALRAKEAAKRQREEEKRLAREEKIRVKEEKRLAKEQAKGQALIEKQNAAARAQMQAGEAETTDKGPYMLPPVSLLNPLPRTTADHGDVGEMSERLIKTLQIFGIDATMDGTVEGPVVTKYKIALAPGTRYNAVTSLSDNLMGALHAKSLRIEAPIPGEDLVGIEVPNRKAVGISFREIFESDAWRNSRAELPLLFGKDAAGRELVADLASMPHMLVAGATGQGKSVCLNSLINGLLMTRTPEQLKLIMVDPKSVEFTWYATIPHLLVPVITDNRKVVFALHWAVAEMEKRLKLFARAKVKNIYDFNHRKTFTQTDMFGSDDTINGDIPRTVPYIVIIIDEVADLMAAASKEVTPDISRLTAKARAAGIHLILATQRPDAKIITGTIKANIPGRVAFKTATSIDSRTILDDTGAENLIGKGDMLFKTKDGLLIRAQGAWISDDEIGRITQFIEQHADVQFDDTFAKKLGRVKEAAIDDPFASNEDDPDNQQGGGDSMPSSREMVKAAEDADLYKRALECIINTKRASTSHFQRRLGIGYNHAAKLCDKLEDAGVIGPQKGAGPRDILMDQDQLLAIFNESGNGGAGDVADNGAATDDADTTGDLFSTEEEQ